MKGTPVNVVLWISETALRMDWAVTHGVFILILPLFCGITTQLVGAKNDTTSKVLHQVAPAFDRAGSSRTADGQSATTLRCIGKNGFYADPAHLCTVYYLCSPDGSHVMFECPLGKGFDSTTQTCVDASVARCLDIEVPSTKPASHTNRKKLKSQGESATQPNFASDQLQWKLENSGTDFLALESDSGLNSQTQLAPAAFQLAQKPEYFTKLQSTRIGSFISRLPPIFQTAASNIANQLSQRTIAAANSNFECFERRGYVPDVAQRCNTYYYCDSTGKALKFNCPLDLAFDRVEQACVYPHKTSCVFTESASDVDNLFSAKQLPVNNQAPMFGQQSIGQNGIQTTSTPAQNSYSQSSYSTSNQPPAFGQQSMAGQNGGQLGVTQGSFSTSSQGQSPVVAFGQQSGSGQNTGLNGANQGSFSFNGQGQLPGVSFGQQSVTGQNLGQNGGIISSSISSANPGQTPPLFGQQQSGTGQSGIQSGGGAQSFSFSSSGQSGQQNGLQTLNGLQSSNGLQTSVFGQQGGQGSLNGAININAQQGGQGGGVLFGGPQGGNQNGLQLGNQNAIGTASPPGGQISGVSFGSQTNQIPTNQQGSFQQGTAQQNGANNVQQQGTFSQTNPLPGSQITPGQQSGGVGGSQLPGSFQIGSGSAQSVGRINQQVPLNQQSGQTNQQQQPSQQQLNQQGQFPLQQPQQPQVTPVSQITQQQQPNPGSVASGPGQAVQFGGQSFPQLGSTQLLGAPTQFPQQQTQSPFAQQQPQGQTPFPQQQPQNQGPFPQIQQQNSQQFPQQPQNQLPLTQQPQQNPGQFPQNQATQQPNFALLGPAGGYGGTQQPTRPQQPIIQGQQQQLQQPQQPTIQPQQPNPIIRQPQTNIAVLGPAGYGGGTVQPAIQGQNAQQQQPQQQNPVIRQPQQQQPQPGQFPQQQPGFPVTTSGSGYAPQGPVTQQPVIQGQFNQQQQQQFPQPQQQSSTPNAGTNGVFSQQGQFPQQPQQSQPPQQVPQQPQQNVGPQQFPQQTQQNQGIQGQQPNFATIGAGAGYGGMATQNPVIRQPLPQQQPQPGQFPPQQPPQQQIVQPQRPVQQPQQNIQPTQQQFPALGQPSYGASGSQQSPSVTAPNLNQVNNQNFNTGNLPLPQMGLDEPSASNPVAFNSSSGSTTASTDGSHVSQIAATLGMLAGNLSFSGATESSAGRQMTPHVPQIDASCNGLSRGFYAEEGCRNYFYCSTFGERLNYSCQTGMRYNIILGLCEEESKVTCVLPLRKTDTLQLDDAFAMFDCTGRTGNFPDISSGCRFFHRCGPNGQAETHQCFGKMLFSAELDICTKPESVVCAGNISSNNASDIQQAGATTRATASLVCAGVPIGRYANVEDGCRSFWICDESGRDKVQNCPPGTLFDNTVQSCDLPVNVDCPRFQTIQEPASDAIPTRLPTTRIPDTTFAVTMPLVGKDFTCQGHVGFFGNVPDECRTYYYCAKDGKHYKFTCPLNYRYSEIKESCDAPDRTICESILSRETNHTQNIVTVIATTMVPGPEMTPQESLNRPVWSELPAQNNNWFKLAEAQHDNNSHQQGTWNSFPSFVRGSQFPRPQQQIFLSHGSQTQEQPTLEEQANMQDMFQARNIVSQNERPQPVAVFASSNPFGIPKPVTVLRQNFPTSNGNSQTSNLNFPSSNQNFPTSNQNLQTSNLNFPTSNLNFPTANQNFATTNLNFPTSSLNSPALNFDQQSFRLNPDNFSTLGPLFRQQLFQDSSFQQQQQQQQPNLNQGSVPTRSPFGSTDLSQNSQSFPAGFFRPTSPRNSFLGQDGSSFLSPQHQQFLQQAQLTQNQQIFGGSPFPHDFFNDPPAFPTQLQVPFPTDRPFLGQFERTSTNALQLIPKIQDQPGGHFDRTRLPLFDQPGFNSPFPVFEPTTARPGGMGAQPMLFPPAQSSGCVLGKPGYFPDIFAKCRNYVFCDGRGGRAEYTCPPGMAFNATLVACDLENLVLCQRSFTTVATKSQSTSPVPTNPCWGRSSGYYADYASGCRDYFYCAAAGASGSSEKVDYHCPNSFFFDEYRGVCVESGMCLLPDVSREQFDLQTSASTNRALTERVPRQFELQQLNMSPFAQLTDSRSGFQCKEIGSFADFDSGCIGFWTCDAPLSPARFIKCPPSSLFDPIQGQCIPSMLVQCLPQPEPPKKQLVKDGFTCMGKNAGFYSDISEGCRKFHHCIAEGEMFTYTCPFDWLFQEKLGECVPPENFTCPVPSISKYSEFDCFGKSGYYADFGQQCQVFHLCRLNGSRTTMSCPPLMVFDENEAKCVYGNMCAPPLPPSEFVDAPLGASNPFQRVFECPVGSTGFFGDPFYACRIYWQCVDGNKLQNRTCPGYLRFNATTEICEHPNHVICLDPYSLEALFPGLIRGGITSETAFGFVNQFRDIMSNSGRFGQLEVFPQLPKTGCEPGQVGYFADEKTNCHSFYHCSPDMTKRSYTCPGPMMFNESVSKCQDQGITTCFSSRSKHLLSDRLGFGSGFEQPPTTLGPCNGRTGFVADVSSGCRQFFTCYANGSFLNQSCPGALVFNERASFCDWPSTARCGESVFVSRNSLSGHNFGLPEGPFAEIPFGSSPTLDVPTTLQRDASAEDSFFRNKFSQALFPPSHQLKSMLGSGKNGLDQLKSGGTPLKSGASPFMHPAEFEAGRPHPGIPEFRRLNPEIVLPGFPVDPLQPRLPRPVVFDAFGFYSPGRRHHLLTPAVPTTTTTPAPGTTTGIPGMEEGEYEPEEGLAAAPAAAAGGSTTTTAAPAGGPAPARVAPLVMEPTTAPPVIPNEKNLNTVVVDPSKPHGVDCYGKKGYFLAPGTGCKSYVFCKPVGTIYSFTCPGEYMYNAEKEICDWPENVLCMTASSHSVPQGPTRRWRRSVAVAPKPSPSFVCPEREGYYADTSNDCLSFFHCDENGTFSSYDCPDARLRFDEARGVCDWGARIKCGNKSEESVATPLTVAVAVFQETNSIPVVPPSIDCPSTGFYADYLADCEQFYFCGPEGVRLNYTCPKEQRYDEYREKCDNASLVSCKLQKISRGYGKKVRLVTRTRLISASGEASADCRHRRGLFADSRSNCFNFFYCSPQGLKFEYSCPENMAFNNAVNACDDPSHSSCAVIP